MVKLWEFALCLELCFFKDKNEINRFKGKDVVTTLLVQGAEFVKCEYTLKNCLGITICFRGNTRAPRSWKISFNKWLLRQSTRNFNVPYPWAKFGHLNFWRLDCSNSRPLGPKYCSNALSYRWISLSNPPPEEQASSAPVAFNTRDFKIWRRHLQWQHHKSMIWLVEWRKIIVLHVRHGFRCNFWRSLPIFIFEVSTTTRARSSKSFILCMPLHETHSCQASESVLRLFCTTWSTRN